MTELFVVPVPIWVLGLGTVLVYLLMTVVTGKILVAVFGVPGDDDRAAPAVFGFFWPLTLPIFVIGVAVYYFFVLMTFLIVGRNGR